MSEKQHIAITTGGSGGHVVPAMATADALLARGYAVDFFTDARGKKFIEPRPDLAVHIIPGSSPSGSIKKILRGILDLAHGFWVAFGLLRRARCRAIIGFGSYASFSACAAAILLRIPLFLHEQNAVLGRANEALHRFAVKVITSMPNVEGIEIVPAHKVVEAGYPIRGKIAELAATPYPAPQPNGPLDILCIGGSQGAQIFGEIIPAALAKLEEADLARIKLTLQVTPPQLDNIRTKLAMMNVAAVVNTFFTDMAMRYSQTQLVIARSGMSTVAEVLASGRPAIFVPLPHGHRLEQYKNPAAPVAAGGAWLCDQKDFTPDWLADQLQKILRDETDLAAMAAIARSFGRPQAAQAVAEVVLQHIQ